MQEIDIVIIGAGVIGLAVSHYLSSGSAKDIVVVEKNSSFGQETSSRNSEVIHAGIYYPRDSLKAKTSIRGKHLLYELCSECGIPHKRIGKLLVASDNESAGKLETIYGNALECGVKSLRFLEKEETRELEPDIKAESVLFSPDSGIIDSHSLMKFLYQSAKQRKVDFAFSVEVIGINRNKDFYEVAAREPGGDIFSFRTGAVVNCAGLNSDGIAEMVGMDAEKHRYRIHYCKGQYFRISDPGRFSINHLIYPPPTELGLGIHITPDLAGGLRVGPDAKYVAEIDYDIDEKDKEIFCDSVRKFLPGLRQEDMIPDTAGIRPRLKGERDGFRDFIIRNESEQGFPNFVNLIGIDSPGLTSCLAIAELVVKELRISQLNNGGGHG